MATTNKGLDQVSQGMVRADIPLAAAISAIDASIPYQLSRTNVDGKTVASTTLYTVPTGKKLIVTAVVIRVATATGISTDVTFSIGGNSTSYNDLLASTTATLDAAGKYYLSQIASGLKTAYAAGTAIKCKVTTGATGTTLTLAVDLIGYLV